MEITGPDVNQPAKIALMGSTEDGTVFELRPGEALYVEYDGEAKVWRKCVEPAARRNDPNHALSDADTLLFLARSLFYCDPRIVAHVVPRADATLPTTRHWSSEKYDAAYARAWELGREQKHDLEWRCRNEAIGRASHVLVDVRTTGHVLVLLKP